MIAPDPPSPPAINVTCGYRTSLRYHALAFVPLPGDDANLHRPDYATDWRERILADRTVDRAALAAAIEEARTAAAQGPSRLRHQVEPLLRADLPIGEGPLGPLESLLDESYRAAWAEAIDATAVCRESFAAFLRDRAPLFAPLRLAGIRRLDVELCPSLSGAGRAVRPGDRYRVAVALPADEPEREAAFLQLVHECCHPISDPGVAVRKTAAEYSTSRSSPGHARHALRERAALVLGCHWLAADERLLRAYLRWTARFDRGPDLERRLRDATDLPEECRSAVLRRASEAAEAVRRPTG